MKNVISKTKYVLMALIMVTAFSCSPEDGADGAQGPAGPAGQDGQDGNANVTSVFFANFNLVTGTNDVSVPEITQEIFDSGFVYSYVRLPGASIWEEIPISSNGSVQLETIIEVGNVRLESTFTQTLDLRFVIVASSN